MGNRFTYVMGNHERLLLDRKRDKDVWFWNGGKKTVESFAEAGVPLEEADSFIRENCVKLRDFGRYVVVHGGITYDDLEWNDEDECVWNRDCARGGHHGGRLLVIGHTPSMAGPYHASVDGVYRSLAGTEREPLPERGVILIDTGAVFGGDLTAFVDHLDGTFSVVSWPERKTFP